MPLTALAGAGWTLAVDDRRDGVVLSVTVCPKLVMWLSRLMLDVTVEDRHDRC